MEGPKHKIAVAQVQSTADIEKNLKNAVSMVEEAARNGAALVAFPENFLLLGSGKGLELAEEVTSGANITRFQELARKHNISILMGSSPEKVAAEPTKIYNTSVLLDRQGAIVAHYRKVHLFDLVLPPQVNLQESKSVKQGDLGLVVAKHEIGTVGLTVCYDLRFPVMYQRLARKGAEVIFVPSAFTVPTGLAHWIPLLHARAIETQTYVVAPAQIGQHSDTRHSFGSSVVIDPWGTIVARAPEYPCLIYADIDLAYLRQVRARMPLQAHAVRGIDYDE
jgi:predicted amidohydrolase